MTQKAFIKTVVFQINDQSAYDKLLKPLLDKFGAQNENEPIFIRAMSSDDEIHRIELIEAACETDSLEAAEIIKDILSHPDITKIKDISELSEDDD